MSGPAAVRIASPDDPSDVAAVVRMRAHWTGAEPGDDPAFAAQLVDWWSRRSADRVVWLAQPFQVAGPCAAVAMANLAVFDRMPQVRRPLSRWGYLANLWVEPDHRRLGIGRAVVAEVLAWSRAERLERVVLNPSPMSVPLYASLGFRPADDLMRLDLSVGA